MSRNNKTKLDQNKLNPCLKEQELTYKCFDRYNYDKEKCELHMQNYKTCKTFWNQVQTDRRRRGIRPLLPDVEEREKIKNEYLSKK